MTDKSNDAYQATLKRIQLIQDHLNNKTRSGRLAGKVCIITGAGSKLGMGRATAIQFAHEGAKALYLLDINGENFEELEKLIKSRYPDVKVHCHVCDASDQGSISSITKKAIDDNGRLDVYFANAARARMSSIRKTKLNDLAETIRINTNSVLLALQQSVNAMQITSNEKPYPGGSIIVTTSVAGIRVGGGMVDYSASKAAVISLTQNGAYEFGKKGIRCNAIAPGLILSGMNNPSADISSALSRSQITWRGITSSNPLGRHGVSEEIANVVTFLASDESSYVTGVVLPIDGGWSISLPSN